MRSCFLVLHLFPLILNVSSKKSLWCKKTEESIANRQLHIVFASRRWVCLSNAVKNCLWGGGFPWSQFLLELFFKMTNVSMRKDVIVLNRKFSRIFNNLFVQDMIGFEIILVAALEVPMFLVSATIFSRKLQK